MQTFSLKTIALIGAAFLATSGNVMANEMINNQASGYVGGVTQSDAGNGNDQRFVKNDFNVEVGSISAKSAQGNSAFGHVDGVIYQNVKDGSQNTLDIKVGSIKASKALGNKTESRVSGDIIQEISGEGQRAIVHVGAIDAGEDGYAFNNRASGTVKGDVRQFLGYGSNANLRVGSITQTSNRR